MKLKFDRYPGYNCVFIRDTIGMDKIKLLLVGLDSLIKDLTEPTIIHLGFAKLGPTETQVLAAFKKKLSAYKVPQYWISNDKLLGEYKNFDLLATRIFFNPKFKPIVEKIKAEDEIQMIHVEIEKIQEEITKLGGSDESVKKIILENDALRAQKETLEGSLSAHFGRLPFQAPYPSDDPDLPARLQKAYDDLTKIAGVEIPL